MSASSGMLFSLTMRHLSADAKRAGSELPEAQLGHLTSRQLRAILDAAAKLAPTVAYPAEPEIRIETTAGKFVVQIRNGALKFISWSSTVRGSGEMTAAQIMAAIAGESGETDPVEAVGARGQGLNFLPSPKILLCAIAIIAVNSFTVWFATRPPRAFAPNFTMMDAAPAERLLADVAGIYETTGPGERRLEIRKDGSVNRVKYSTQRKVVKKEEFSVKAVRAAGEPALITERKALILVKDPLSVVLYGDTYRRVSR